MRNVPAIPLLLLISFLIFGGQAPAQTRFSTNASANLEALRWIEKSDYPKAFSILQTLTQQSVDGPDKIALFNLSVIYRRGLGVLPQPQKADTLARSSGFPSGFSFRWPDGSVYVPSVTLNSLRYTNRAQCALDSKQPTESFFLLIDAYNAGKVAHSLAQVTGRNPGELSLVAQEEFRLTVTALVRKIVDALLAEKLPLLPAPDSLSVSAPEFKKLMLQCGQSKDIEEVALCPLLNSYLMKVWDRSGLEREWSQEKVNWAGVDTYSKENFLLSSQQKRVGCYYLKKFSGLQDHLFKTKPDLESLNRVGHEVLIQSSLAEDCHARGLSSRYSTIQMDLMNLKAEKLEKRFHQIGFDFWSSVKLYVAWAWRSRLAQLSSSPQLTSIFQSIPIEESMMFIPNGCKSIDVPSCSSEYLSEQSLRDFAYMDTVGLKDKNLFVPRGPQISLVNEPLPAVNSDIMRLQEMKSASVWIERYKTRLTRQRAWISKKNDDAQFNLKMIRSQFSDTTLAQEVQGYAHNNKASEEGRKRLYYLCSEFNLAAHQQISLLKSDLDSLQDIRMKHETTFFGADDWKNVNAFYQGVSGSVARLCQQLETERLWSGTREIYSNDDFFDWAKELLKVEGATARTPFQPKNGSVPLISISTQNGQTLAVCGDSVECSRLVLKSMVDLMANITYAQVFTHLKNNISSPAILNPYAERVACQIYDPWFKTKASIVNLLADLGNTAAFGWNTIPAYAHVDLERTPVTSLQKRIENGEVSFFKQGGDPHAKFNLIGDFSNWNVPCAVSISNANAIPIQFLNFTGISIGACRSKNENGLLVNSASSYTPKSSSNSACFTCTLNLSTARIIGNVVPKAIPIVKGGVYLLSGLVRFFKGMSDPVDVPHLQHVDINSAVAALAVNGKIPKICEEDLTHGRSCRALACHIRAQNYIRERTGAPAIKLEMTSNPVKIDRRFEIYRVRAQGIACDGEIEFDMTTAENCMVSESYFWKGTKNCRHLIESTKDLN